MAQEFEYVTNRSQLNEYNNINSLLLSPSKSTDNYTIQARYLFFDIFAYNKTIYLICPVYTKNYINYDDIKLSYKNVTLKPKETHKHIYYEPIVILSFNMPSDFRNINAFINVNVSYRDYKSTYRLCHIKKLRKSFFLSQSTLCKDDYKLFLPWYNYYTKQGTEQFYIYYNGIIPDSFKKICESKKNIILISWDFHYFNNGKIGSQEVFHHHAQMGQLNHALWKYGKIMSHHLMCNDLDEYFHIDRTTIKKHLVNNFKRHNAYCFRNCWAKETDTRQRKLPDTYPNKFYHSNKSYSFGNKSKMVYKCDNFNAIGIHTPHPPSKWNQMKIDKRSNLIMFHFYEWSLFIYKNKEIFATTQNNRKFDKDEVIDRAMKLL